MCPDELWNLFAADDGPGFCWVFMVPMLVLVVPALLLLACVLGSAVFDRTR